MWDFFCIFAIVLVIYVAGQNTDIQYKKLLYKNIIL